MPLGNVIGSHIWFHIWNVIGFHIWYKTLLLLVKLLIVKLSIKEDSNLPCIVTKLSSAGLLDTLRASWAQFGHYHYYRGRLFAVNLHKKANWRRSEIEQWAPYWWHHLPALLHLTLYVLHVSHYILSYICPPQAYYIYHPSVHITSYICPILHLISFCLSTSDDIHLSSFGTYYILRLSASVHLTSYILRLYSSVLYSSWSERSSMALI